MTGSEPIPLIPSGRRVPLGPVQALSQAYEDILTLLFKPFNLGRWLWLSLICLFLGGGTPSAAFNWALGTLPSDIGFQTSLGRAREYATEHLWVIAVLSLMGLAIILAVLYLRSLFRFILVDVIVKQEVAPGRAWRETRSIGRSYFRWLLGALGVILLALLGGAVIAYPYLRAAAASGIRSGTFWVTLIAILLADVLFGLGLAIVIVLTDDLAVPLMYAEQLRLPAAWRKLSHHLRAEPVAFTVYVLLRFAVGVATGVAILFFLFPVLLGLFSGAIMTGALVVLTLHLLGMLWSWSPFTIALAAAGLAVLLSLVLILLSVVGMPAQVFIQDFGLRFIASRSPALQQLLPAAMQESEGA